MLKIKANHLSILFLFLLMFNIFNSLVKGEEIEKNVSIHELKYHQLKNLESSKIKFIKPLEYLDFDLQTNEAEKQCTLKFYFKQESDKFKQEPDKFSFLKFCFFEFQGEEQLTIDANLITDTADHSKKDEIDQKYGSDAIEEYLSIYHATTPSSPKILVNIETIKPELKKQNTQTPVKKNNFNLEQIFLGINILMFFILLVILLIYQFIKIFINCDKGN